MGDLDGQKQKEFSDLGSQPGAGLVAKQVLAQAEPQHLDAAPPPPKRELPHRKVKTTPLFKAPPGYPNAVAIAPEGLWVAEQKAQNYGPGIKTSPEACWLLDWNGKLLKTCSPNPATPAAWRMAMASSGWAPMAARKATTRRT
jgi:hypothetical protein